MKMKKTTNIMDCTRFIILMLTHEEYRVLSRTPKALKTYRAKLAVGKVSCLHHWWKIGKLSFAKIRNFLPLSSLLLTLLE
ncbi:hypothetical protein AV530_005015 [Patagioenas fasciata monilis]|uniref:Uncharacterized protein n=1 Tax=Patagioenas fasciata monilis TaxID=372326 RepID=A0A1V4K3R1_PATFA|nr:hypothetical protein AV530_005015 [Patagioenas fasciata monilis]